MIEKSAERRALPREIINQPAALSFDGIRGVHPCVVRDINAFGACLSTPYNLFASEFDLSFGSLHRTLACRVVWRRVNLAGVVFVVRASKLARAKVEPASIFADALPPMRLVETDAHLPKWEFRTPTPERRTCGPVDPDQPRFEAVAVDC
jgi:hypothetical protein